MSLSKLIMTPTVVRLYVNHWMSWGIFNHRSEDGPSVEEAFAMLVEMILEGGLSLQMRIVHKVDVIEQQTRPTYELAFMHLRDDRWEFADFACDQDRILDALRLVEDGEQATLRMYVIMAYLFSRKDTTIKGSDGKDGGGIPQAFRYNGYLFEHYKISIDLSSAMYTNFADQDLFNLSIDRSAFFIALGMYLIGAHNEISNWADEDVDSNDVAFTSAQLEAWRILIERYEKTIQHLAPNQSLPEQYKTYYSQLDAENFGIHDDVLTSSALTMLWLQWAWTTNVKETGGALSELLENLWFAKSKTLLCQYYQFFAAFQHLCYTDFSALARDEHRKQLYAASSASPASTTATALPDTSYFV